MSNRRKRIGQLRSRAKAMSTDPSFALGFQDAQQQADEQVHRLIAGGSRRPAVAALAEKPAPLTAGEKSAIFLNAAEAIIADHGGRNLREVKRMANTRRVAIR